METDCSNPCLKSVECPVKLQTGHSTESCNLIGWQRSCDLKFKMAAINSSFSLQNFEVFPQTYYIANKHMWHVIIGIDHVGRDILSHTCPQANGLRPKPSRKPLGFWTSPFTLGHVWDNISLPSMINPLNTAPKTRYNIYYNMSLWKPIVLIHV